MASARTCTECPNKLVYPDGRPKPAGTKTCSQVCRQKRARRIKASNGRKGLRTPHEVAPMVAAVKGEVDDVAREVMVEEIRPLVREAMTAEVLDAIGTLVKLTPKAIGKLEQDLESDDEQIRQRAYTLLLRYTMGNPSVAPPPSEQAPAPMSVIFNIPRPGDPGPADTTPPESAELPAGDAEELRQCGDCSQHKTDAEFVGASSRCQACFDALHDTLAQRFAVDDPTAP